MGSPGEDPSPTALLPARAHKYLLSNYNDLGTLLGLEETTVSKTRSPHHHGAYLLVEERYNRQINNM